MTHPVPEAVPATLRAGDTATWRRNPADYPASDGWAMDYILVTAAAQIAIAASVAGNEFLVEVSPATTALWTAGRYAWQERVSKSGKIFTSGTGSLQIVPSFAAATSGYDARSHAQKTLDALEAWIEHKSPTVASYQIGDRQMQHIPITSLLALRDKYRREVRAESGQSSRVYLRF